MEAGNPMAMKPTRNTPEPSAVPAATVRFDPAALTDQQRDGHACVVCSADCTTSTVASAPVGIVDGCQVFACSGCADRSACPSWCTRDHSTGAPKLHTRTWLPAGVNGRPVLVSQVDGAQPTVALIAPAFGDVEASLWDLTPVRARELAGLLEEDTAGRLRAAADLLEAAAVGDTPVRDTGTGHQGGQGGLSSTAGTWPDGEPASVRTAESSDHACAVLAAVEQLVTRARGERVGRLVAGLVGALLDDVSAVTVEKIEAFGRALLAGDTERAEVILEGCR